MQEMTMPRKTDGKSLKPYRATVWFAGKNNDAAGQQLELTVLACNIQGAVGRAAREARKSLKGRFVEATVTVYQETTEKDTNDPEPNL